LGLVAGVVEAVAVPAVVAPPRAATAPGVPGALSPQDANAAAAAAQADADSNFCNTRTDPRLARGSEC
jgi:hypothetical protein